MNKNTEISERIAQLIENIGVNPNEFAKKLGYSRSQNVYDILNGKSSPSFDFFNRLLNSEYSVLFDPAWLITGKRSAIKDQSLINEPVAVYGLRSDRVVNEIQQIPLYNIEVAASIVNLFQDHYNGKPIDFIRIPGIPKCDGALYITGDSMYPLLKSGDIAIYKQIEDLSNSVIFWGEMYIVGFEYDSDMYVVVKYIQKSEQGNDYITLASYNRHHEPVDIPKAKIKALALVKASVRINSMG
jgi:phage repressor protein C with HTH and peptisase S24 domain